MVNLCARSPIYWAEVNLIRDKMDATYSSETFFKYQDTTGRYIPEVTNFLH
jgi:hypothetical protein